jgi:hypothetical protein
MEQLNVVLIKLANGENIICETLETLDTFTDTKFIEVFNPVLLNILRIPRGTRLMESYMMLPWFGFSKTDSCKIFSDKVITMVEVSESIKENYLEYLENNKEDSDESENKSVSFEESPSDSNMEIEEFLESVMEKIGEQLEEDEEYEGRDGSIIRGIRRSTRTLH